MNYERYLNLLNKYTVSKDQNNTDADVVICSGIQNGYSKQYIVTKRPEALSDDDIAIICDNGRLPFGYSAYGNIFNIYMD